MTPRERAKDLLVERDGFPPEVAEEWLDDHGHLETMLSMWRRRRASALEQSGWVETAKSAKAGEMVRALAAVSVE